MIKRNLFNEDSSIPVVRTPNKNAHIESFHRIFEDECFSVNEFESYKDIYVSVDEFMERYNKRRIHSSLGYMKSEEFYNLYSGETLNGWLLKLSMEQCLKNLNIR